MKNNSYTQVKLATPQSRLIAFALDSIIFSLTLGIGWLIWFFAISSRGVTPGHDLLGHQVVDARTQEPLSAGKMIIRECLLKGVLNWFLASILFFINYLVNGALIFRGEGRAVHDYLISSQVIQIREPKFLQS